MTLAHEPRLQPELYFLEGYYTAPPPIDPAAWQTRLAAYLGHVEAIGDGAPLMFALHDYRCDYADRPGAPTMITLLATPAEAPDADALQQSWGWMEAADIVPQCPYRLIINEFLGRLLDPNQRLQMFHDLLIEEGKTSPYAEILERWKPHQADIMARVTTQVPCAEYFDVRDDVLRAHATQIDPAGTFFGTPVDVQQKLWPTEEFELAATRVRTSIPEDDLFAGIPADSDDNE